MTLVDTNVLLDLLTDDPVWAGWSLEALDSALLDGGLLINDVIYAELAGRFETIEPLNEFVSGVGLEMASMSPQALFLAAKAFRRYRASGGARTGALPDFFIGAQAAASDYALITRDVARYQTYFPDIRLISPKLN